ncbi:MAG: hypothetical protein R2724_00020 [Bryobacterales bacterium]
MLLDHPAVQQAVTFAMPHDKLGEEVAAAIVLREAPRRPRRRSASLHRPAWPTSRSRARCSSSRRSPRAQPERCSASAWRRSLA